MFKNLYILISLLTLIFLIFFLGNSWIERSIEIENKYQKYISEFKYLDQKSNNCILITNNKDLYFYWLNFKKGIVLPTDGFLRNSTLKEALEEINITLKILSYIQKPTDIDIYKIIKLATHNFYTSTRSTIASSLNFKDTKEKKMYLKSRKDINSMEPWSMALNNLTYEYIAKYNDTIVPNELNDKMIIFYHEIKNNEFFIEDNCF